MAPFLSISFKCCRAAMLMSTESLWGYAIAISMGEEALNFQVLLGGLVIFAGVLVTESELFIMKQAKKRKKKRSEKRQYNKSEL